MRYSEVLVALVALLAATPACLPAQSVVPSATPRRGHSIVMREEALMVKAGQTLGDLLSARLPLVVARGRFQSGDGPTTVCLYVRRSATRAVDGDLPVNRPQPCSMLTVYVDGVRIRKPGEYVASYQAYNFESVELLRGPAETARHGLATNDDVLLIWTRGHGPHARSQAN